MRKWGVAAAVIGMVLTAHAVAHAGFIGWGFPACEIAHPDNCTLIGLSGSQAACADLLGTFDCHHNDLCHTASPGCACNGPGIAELEGLAVPNACLKYGLKRGWYHFDDGALKGPLTLKGCKAESHHCFGIGFPNYEQGFTKE